MKSFKKNSLIKKSCITFICLSLGLILPGCSAIQNISRKPETAVISRPASIPPLTESLETLSFLARIAIQTSNGDISLTARVTYTGMDTLNIRVKDPLKRQLATLTLTNSGYRLWLQRENRHLSGKELPQYMGDYSVPQLPLQDIAAILIGQVDPENNTYKSKYDRQQRLSRISTKTNPVVTVTYNDWVPIATYHWLPTFIELTGSRDIKIAIHYSQFQIELRKLT